MVNMDMVGRLRENRLTVFGSYSSPQLPKALEGLNHRHRFDLTLNNDGVGASDHGPFYYKDIPSVFFFTGTHAEYHSPADDWDLINAGGEAQVLNFIRDLVRWVDSLDEALPFQKVKESAPAGGGRTNMKIKLGITPDFSRQVKGMAIQAVSPGHNADLAGMQAGDILVAVDGREIAGIREYMYRMQDLEAGRKTVFTVLREGQLLNLECILK